MRISTLTALILPSAFLFVACGSDGGGGGKGSEVTDPNTVQSAKGTAEATKTLTAIQPGADSAAGQGAVSQVGGSMMNLVNGYKAAKLQAAAGSAAQPQTTPGTFTYENDHMSADFTYSQANYNIQYKVELDLSWYTASRSRPKRSNTASRSIPTELHKNRLIVARVSAPGPDRPTPTGGRRSAPPETPRPSGPVPRGSRRGAGTRCRSIRTRRPP